MVASSVCHLADLENGLPGLTPTIGKYLAEASVYCFETNNHSAGLVIRVEGSFKALLKFDWTTRPTAQGWRAWNDQDECTEFGACGVAILLVLNLTEYTVIERSKKGTGFDYWLGFKDSTTPFQNAARLEVSGILKGNNKDIRARVNRKKQQTQQSDGSLPALVAVVEFSQPVSHLVRK